MDAGREVQPAVAPGPVTETRVEASRRRLDRRYFPELDGIRAVSILLVFTVHVGTPFWAQVNGGTGVSIFFVLSGFLITTLALREEASRGRLDLRAFYVRRIFRIYPLYFTVLAMYAVLLLGLGLFEDRREVFIRSLPYYLGFMPEVVRIGNFQPQPPFAGAWSLGIEEKFYLVWPLLGFALLAARFRPRIAVLCVLVVGTVIGTLFSIFFYILAPYALIAMGCVAAVLAHRPEWTARVAVFARPWVLAALLAALAVIQVSLPAITEGMTAFVLYGVPVTLALIGIVAGDGPVNRFLTLRPLVFLGRISYAFYLSHNFGINGVQLVLPKTEFFQGFVAVPIGLAVAIAMAWVLHLVIERPMLRWGHRITARMRARESDASPAAAS
ncbi:unannotated protein [freshwater metagenome]|uniref:Unannotated protein n=1 Tax=freshwater metagenome TaxID=449393 RepID=A0A6J6QUI6_9ZZZZ